MHIPPLPVGHFHRIHHLRKAQRRQRHDVQRLRQPPRKQRRPVHPRQNPHLARERSHLRQLPPVRSHPFLNNTPPHFVVNRQFKRLVVFTLQPRLKVRPFLFLGLPLSDLQRQLSLHLLTQLRHDFLPLQHIPPHLLPQLPLTPFFHPFLNRLIRQHQLIFLRRYPHFFR